MNKLFFSLMIFTGIIATLPAPACPDVSGRYIAFFDPADFRQFACMTAVQNGCTTVTVSDWSITLKNGVVDAADPKVFPPRTWTLAEIGSFSPTWRLANVGECGR